MIYDLGAIKLDLEEYLFTINFKKPEQDVKLVDLLLEKIKEYENPLVCLSGGYDSQFMCLLLKQAGIEFSAVTYETMWGLNVVNSPDVAMAKNFAKKHNIDLQVIQLDFKTFLESEKYIEYAQKYKSSSPQVAYHCYFLDQLDYTDRSLVMGGDIPNFNIDDSGNVLSQIHSNLYDFKTIIIPYKEYSIQNNVKICKDLLFYTPEILYMSLENYFDMIKTNRLIGTSDANTTGNYLKELYYNNILEENCESVLMSNTGFENIRVHYMSLSGNYDEFNNKYRSGLIYLLDKYYLDVYGIDTHWKAISRKYKGWDCAKDLIDDIQNFCDTEDLEIIKHYKLEF